MRLPPRTATRLAVGRTSMRASGRRAADSDAGRVECQFALACARGEGWRRACRGAGKQCRTAGEAERAGRIDREFERRLAALANSRVRSGGLAGGLRGVERETLRVTPAGRIAAS